MARGGSGPYLGAISCLTFCRGPGCYYGVVRHNQMTVLPIHEFDQVYVISDLHIGGLTNFQIFRQGSLLASLIDWLTQRDTGQRVGLCINGDTVDFLAEQSATYFDPVGATTKLDRMFQDAAFQPVWLALQRLVATPNRRLVLTLGNHDLELALPWVQEHLTRFLSQGKDEARGRVTLSFDGAGYCCQVGDKTVLCLHGNEFDAWNLTDHERLRRIGRDAVQGRLVADWTPNAGTKLVIDVMNELKRRYAFVDVLKPEVEAVLPILWVLGEATRSRLNRVVAVSRRLTWDAVRKATGFLGPGEAPTNKPVELSEPLENTAYLPSFSMDRADNDRLLDWAEEQAAVGTEPLSLVEGTSDRLGFGGALWDRVRGRSQDEQAWEALKGLAADSTFAVDREDDTYRRADEFVGQDVDYLITGHTHQARALPRRNGGGRYFNSGTWATLMHLTVEQLKSADAFKSVFQRITAARDLSSLSNLVDQRPTVVAILKGADGITTAALSLFSNDNMSPSLKEISR